jgi:CheY-like chemotaxis protein
MTKRILVVEDQEDLRAILRDLPTASGYTVIEAVEGVEGVAKACSESPDLILMDITAARARRLWCDPVDQSTAWSWRNPDHCRELVRDEGRRRKGPSVQL